MAKLHEVIAAEKTVIGAWSEVYEETLRKLRAGTPYQGYFKHLNMIEESEENRALESAAQEHKPVVTTVEQSLTFALSLWSDLERLQLRKNATNCQASATVMLDGEPLLLDMPIDQLLGLEARVARIRELIKSVPTLDLSRSWIPNQEAGQGYWRTEQPDVTTKTEKQTIPIVLSPPTDKHPAQVQTVNRDVIVGTLRTTYFSGAVSSRQKAAALQRIDQLLVELKAARMRANETEVVPTVNVGEILTRVILEPLTS